MRIVNVEPILLSVPIGNGGLRWSGGSTDTLGTCLVRVTTDDGLTGLGDAYGLGCYAPEVGAAVTRWMADLLVGEDASDIRGSVTRLWGSCLFWGRSGAAVAVISAIENALWDIAGKAAGKPVYELLGGPVHDAVPIYASGGLDAPVEETVREIVQSLEAGFRVVKVRVGHGPAADRSRIAALREAVGWDVGIAVDAVMGHHPYPWSASEAIAVARAMADFDIRWFEEPCAAYDYDGYAAVRRAGVIPVSGGESSCMVAEFRHFFERSALDIAQPDAAHAGGVLELLRIAELAAKYDVTVAPHSWGSGACLMANYHAAFACPNVGMVEYPVIDNPLRTELLREPLRIVGGSLQRPTQPGLGIDLTEETIARYPYIAMTRIDMPQRRLTYATDG